MADWKLAPLNKVGHVLALMDTTKRRRDRERIIN